MCGLYSGCDLCIICMSLFIALHCKIHARYIWRHMELLIFVGLTARAFFAPRNFQLRRIFKPHKIYKRNQATNQSCNSHGNWSCHSSISSLFWFILEPGSCQHSIGKSIWDSERVGGQKRHCTWDPAGGFKLLLYFRGRFRMEEYEFAAWKSVWMEGCKGDCFHCFSDLGKCIGCLPHA